MTISKLNLLKIFKVPPVLLVFITSFSVFAVVSIANISSAEAFDFSAMGVASSSSYKVSPTPDVLAGGAGFGLGVTLGFELFPFFSLELGTLYLSHGLSATAGSLTTNINYNYLQIPALIVFTPIPFIALEAGGYYGIPVSTSSTGIVPSTLVQVGSSGYSSSNDFGLLLGAGLRFPLVMLTTLRLDALYEFGLTDVSTGTASQYSRNLDIWAGVTISVL